VARLLHQSLAGAGARGALLVVAAMEAAIEGVQAVVQPEALNARPAEA
jgi:hypothetical protein